MPYRVRAALAPALLFFAAANASAQAPAAPPPVPADVSPLYVVTYIDSRPSARAEAASLLKSYRDASRSASGNLRSVVVRSVTRPGQFVVASAWKDKAAWDAHMASHATQAFREKIAAIRNSPTDDRFHNSLTVGPLDNPGAPAGAVYVVTHIDVIPPRKETPSRRSSRSARRRAPRTATSDTRSCSRPTARITSPRSRCGARTTHSTRTG